MTINHQRQMALEAKRAAKAAVERYKAQHPGAMRLDAKADVWVYPKKPKGYSKHRADVVRMFLSSRQYLGQTNAQIAAQLSDKYAPYKVPQNVLTRSIPPGARKEIEDLLKAAGHDIDLKTCNTLSKIKGALLGRSVAQSSDRQYETTIAFADDAVVIGNKRFPVSVHEKGYPRVRIDGQWVRADVLEALVKAGE